MENYIPGRYVNSFKNLELLKNPANWDILDALINAYPHGRTAEELKAPTKKSISIVYSSIEELKENYIRELEVKRKGKGVKPSSEYIVEDSSAILQATLGFQLAPGSFKLSDDLKKAWDILVPKEDETEVLNRLMQFVQKVIRLTKESDHEDIKRIGPHFGRDYCCKGCGINHEVRDYIRAMLIYLIDKLEVQQEFVEFQNDNQLLTKTAFEKIIKLSEISAQEVLRPQDEKKVVRKATTESSIQMDEGQSNWRDYALRILAIQKDSVKEQIPFTAVDNNGMLLDGTIDRALLRDQITTDTILEIISRDMTDIIEKYEKYDTIFISIDNSIQVKGDDASFPKLSQVETKIEDIGINGGRYVVQGVILDEPQSRTISIDGMSKEAVSRISNRPLAETSRAIFTTSIGDETGSIGITELDGDFLSKLHQNDRIRIINAIPLQDGLILSAYGTIEKIGSGNLDQSSIWLSKKNSIQPHDKVVIIEQNQNEGNVKVTLHKLHILKNYMRLFLDIENTSYNTEVSLYRSRVKAVQNKKQFEHITYYTHERYPYIKSVIPPGVQESGIIDFERVDTTEDDVRFLLPFKKHTFVFDVKLSTVQYFGKAPTATSSSDSRP